jgi:hypothetical protein
MPLRLSELLERIRPAGSPGAPTEGERQRRRDDRATEIADLARLLASFADESAARVEAAQEEAARLRRSGQTRAAEVHAGLSGRVAVAVARVTEHHQDLDRNDEARIRQEADREIARLHARADAEIPHLVDRTMQVIWSLTAPSSDTTAQP